MEHGTINSTLNRGYGTLAGMSFIGAAVMAVPSTLLLEPVPPTEDYLITVAALVTGLVCMALPWERMDARWFHLVGVVGVAESAAAVAIFGQPYVAFYFLVAVAAAYVTPEPKRLVPHLILIGAALVGPVVYGPTEPRETLQVALVVYPMLLLTAGVFAYMRQRVVAHNRSYRLFAEETLALAARIAGRPISTGQSPPAERLPSWARIRVSGRAAGLAAAILALPLLTTGLAAAGVRVPTFASDALSKVGIELPNQGPVKPEPAGAPAPAPSPGAGASDSEREDDSATPAAAAETPSDPPPPGGDSGKAGPGATGDGPLAQGPGGSPEPQPNPPDANGGGDEQPNAGAEPGVPADPLGDVLHDTLTGLDAILNKRRPVTTEEQPPAPEE